MAELCGGVGGGVAHEADQYVSLVSTYIIFMALFDGACFVFYFELANERQLFI